MNNHLNTTRLPARYQIALLHSDIVKLADTLKVFEDSKDGVPTLDQMIETLNGIGTGALSCAGLLKIMTEQARQAGASPEAETQGQVIPPKEDHSRRIREDAHSILQNCEQLSKGLRRLKRNLESHPEADDVEILKLSQQVQSALAGIVGEWEI
jgi:hypothetical protein